MTTLKQDAIACHGEHDIVRRFPTLQRVRRPWGTGRLHRNGPVASCDRSILWHRTCLGIAGSGALYSLVGTASGRATCRLQVPLQD